MSPVHMIQPYQGRQLGCVMMGGADSPAQVTEGDYWLSCKGCGGGGRGAVWKNASLADDLSIHYQVSQSLHPWLVSRFSFMIVLRRMGEQGCGSNYIYFDVGELMTMMVLAALHLDREELSFRVYLKYVFSVLGIKNKESQQMDKVTYFLGPHRSVQLTL